jgi:uncharacterized repeat protein (TIGR03837 family)
MWDLFCQVVDNYGDAGVSWRLARRLADDRRMPVRLWIDDLGVLQKLEPSIDPDAAIQAAAGIEVRLWSALFPAGIEPGEVVIEAFGCRLPGSFVEAMVARAKPPLWINLEYLSAEDWIEGCHRAPSPHPSLPLTKYFFFPGFGERTGGLLREPGLFAERDRFRREELSAYWDSLRVPLADAGELRVSLFSYENAALPELLGAWRDGELSIRLLVPEGRVVPQLCAFLGLSQIAPGESHRQGSLAVHVLPFSDQAAYDRLLWACDLNFVRGEDSFVRAQWAGRPLVWQLYPQAEKAHEAKLEAFLRRYPATAVAGVSDLLRAWNGAAAQPVAQVWRTAQAGLSDWRTRAEGWANVLATGLELADELSKFHQASVQSRPFD